MIESWKSDETGAQARIKKPAGATLFVEQIDQWLNHMQTAAHLVQ